jgi:hypothetical protein
LRGFVFEEFVRSGLNIVSYIDSYIELKGFVYDKSSFFEDVSIEEASPFKA